MFLLQNWFPRYGLYLVGSTMSGFGSNSSDVDMCLLVRPSYVDQRSEALNYLEQIQHSLKYCGNMSADSLPFISQYLQTALFLSRFRGQY